MKNNLFDAHAREQLAGSRPEVPSHIWENIIAKKERNKPVGFWLKNFTKIAASLLFLLTGAGALVYLCINNKEQPSLVQATNVAKNEGNVFMKKSSNTVINNSTKNDGTKNDDVNNVLNKDNDLQSVSSINTITSRPKDNFETVDFLSKKNTSTLNNNNYNDYIVNRQMLNASLLKSSFFNPSLN
ncbi:MAG: hypothetical protein ACKVOM_03790, partial [Ferruginibacter sp.]